MSLKLGVAISLYNKLDELATNVNVIRHHWSLPDVFISVCSNDVSNIEKIGKLDVDLVTVGNSYPVTPKPWKRLRQHDTIKKAIQGCIGRCDFVAQWHADAYALDCSSLISIIDVMEDSGFDVAFRGKWTREFNMKRPVGHVDDHFSFYRCSHLAKTQMFDDRRFPVIQDLAFDLVGKTKHLSQSQIESIIHRSGVSNAGLDGLISNGWSSEGLLCYLIQSVTDEHRIHHYDDLGGNIVDASITFKDDFYPDGISHSSIPPLNFDPVRKFLHSDRWDNTRKIFTECGVPLELIRNA